MGERDKEYVAIECNDSMYWCMKLEIMKETRVVMHGMGGKVSKW